MSKTIKRFAAILISIIMICGIVMPVCAAGYGKINAKAKSVTIAATGGGNFVLKENTAQIEGLAVANWVDPEQSASSDSSSSSKEKDCSTCGGSGRCSKCHGSGTVSKALIGTGKWVEVNCTSCGGTGRCWDCGGDGKK